MKSITILLFILSSCFVSAQTITIFQAKSTTDRTIVEKFIKQNPNHPAVPELRNKLTNMGGQSLASAKPKINALTEEKIEKNSKIGTKSTKGEASEQAKNTAAVLTHLFSNDPNKKEAIIQIVNKSNCNLVVQINGAKFYNLSVPANGQNYILVKKGNYTITTMVCDAKYSQNKAINKDMEIILRAPR